MLSIFDQFEVQYWFSDYRSWVNYRNEVINYFYAVSTMLDVWLWYPEPEMMSYDDYVVR